ncbi:hypothetical protein FOA52_003887 [Chlamydomonas sp. UWO 241]|nr:hypothetical protein FOA52_003887 [Chlamydomonas sp. UWO 241]
MQTELLPLFVRTLKDLVELQHGAFSVPCPMGFYRKACGQVPACKACMPRRVKRLTDGEWRQHVQSVHGEDVHMLANMVQDIWEHVGAPPPGAPSMPCPFGCKHRVQLLSAPPPPPEQQQQQQRQEQQQQRQEQQQRQQEQQQVAALPDGGRYLTGDALDQGVSVSPYSALLMHLVAEHLLELQALAALMDILVLRAYNAGRCSFSVLGPRACLGAHAYSARGHSPGQAHASAPAGPPGAANGAGSPGGAKGAGHAHAHGSTGEEAADAAAAATARAPAGASPHRRPADASPRHLPPGYPSTTRALLASGRPGGVGGVDSTPGPTPRGVDSVDADWWTHVRAAHMADAIATVASLLGRCEAAAAADSVAHMGDAIATVALLLGRCEAAAAAAADAIAPRVSCDMPGCGIHFSSAIDLAAHLLLHLRPRHARFDEAAELLVTAAMTTKDGSGKIRPGGAASAGGAKASSSGGLTCPFVGTSAADGHSSHSAGGASGARPCSYQAATMDALEAHAFEKHFSQLSALGTALSKCGRCYVLSGTHVCPIRVAPALQNSSSTTATGGAGRRGGGTDAAGTGTGAAVAGAQPHYALYGSARELERHMQVHHIPALATLAAFASGLLSGGPSSGGAHCPVCSGDKAASPGTHGHTHATSEASGGTRSLMGGLVVAGPAHMLQHLGTAHPRLLLQVLHALQMLTGASSSNQTTCPLGCGHRADLVAALQMHVASAHARQLLPLAAMAAAEAPLPHGLGNGGTAAGTGAGAGGGGGVSVGVGSSRASPHGDTTPREAPGWSQQDKGCQAIVMTGDQLAGKFLSLVYGGKAKAPDTKPARDPALEKVLREAFSQFDTNNSGNISRGEVCAMMTSMGHSVADADLAAMMTAMGADASGRVSFEQFAFAYERQQATGALTQRMAPMLERALRDAFVAFAVKGRMFAADVKLLLERVGHAPRDSDAAALLTAIAGGQGEGSGTDGGGGGGTPKAKRSAGDAAGGATRITCAQFSGAYVKVQAAIPVAPPGYVPSPVYDPVLMKSLREAFFSFDRDESGSISALDVRAMLARMGTAVPSDEQLAEMLVAMGAQVSLRQFSQVYYVQQGIAPGKSSAEQGAAVKAAFGEFDTDKSGFISASKLKAMVARMGQLGPSDSQFAAMIVAMDAQVTVGAFVDEFTRRQLAAGKSPALDPAQRASLKQAFAEFDVDKSGSISASEVRAMLAKMGTAVPSEEQLAEMLVAMGAQVSLQQFSQVYYVRQGIAPGTVSAEQGAAVKTAFEEFDKDKSGFISASELKAMVARMGQSPPSDSQVAAMMVAMDAQVTFDAFVDVYERQQQAAVKSPVLDRAQLASLKQAIAEFDADKSGSISASKVRAMLGKMGEAVPSDQQLADMLVTMGAQISLRQFSQVYYVQQGIAPGKSSVEHSAAIMTAFEEFDTDKSGFISASKLKAMVTRTGQLAPSDSQVAAMMVAMGAQVTFDAFVDVFMRQQQAAAAGKPPAIDPAQLASLKQAFAEFDTDQSGSISASEVRAMVAKMGQGAPSDEQLAEMLVAMGAQVSLRQFAQVYYAQNGLAPGSQDAALHQAFAEFDKDGSGTISSTEIKAMLASMGQSAVSDGQVAGMLVAMGAEVTFDAFVDVYARQQQQQAGAAGKSWQQPSAVQRPAIDPAQLASLRQAFDSFDADRSGSIASSEVRAIVAKMGQGAPSDEQLAEMLVAMGAQVSLRQFSQVYYAQNGLAPGSQDAALRQAFAEFDKDRTGTISSTEIKAMLASMGQSAVSDGQVAGMLVAMGAEVTFDAFVDVYARQQQQQAGAAGKSRQQPSAVQRPAIDPAQLASLRQAFDSFDADQSGSVSASEVRAMVAKMGQGALSDEQLAEMLVAMGAQVSLRQFSQVYYAQNGLAPGSQDAALRQAFAEFDKDRTGTISSTEIKAMLVSMGQSAASDGQVAGMLVAMGAEVTFDAFVDVYARQQQQQAAPAPAPGQQQGYAPSGHRSPTPPQAAYPATSPAAATASTSATADEDAGLRAAFREFDADKSGTISASEVRAMVNKMGQGDARQQVSEEQLAGMLVAMGAEVGYFDFLDMYHKQAGTQVFHKRAGTQPGTNPDHDAALDAAFKQFDADTSGRISPSEIKALLTKMGQPSGDAVVAQMLVAMEGSTLEVGQASGGNAGMVQMLVKFKLALLPDLIRVLVLPVLPLLLSMLLLLLLVPPLLVLLASVTFESFARVYRSQQGARAPALAGVAAAAPASAHAAYESGRGGGGGGSGGGSKDDEPSGRPAAARAAYVGKDYGPDDGGGGGGSGGSGGGSKDYSGPGAFGREPGDDVLQGTMPDGGGLPPSLMGTHASMIMPELRWSSRLPRLVCAPHRLSSSQALQPACSLSPASLLDSTSGGSVALRSAQTCAYSRTSFVMRSPSSIMVALGVTVLALGCATTCAADNFDRAFYVSRHLAQMNPAYPPPVYGAYPPPVYAANPSPPAYPPITYGDFDEPTFTGFRRLAQAPGDPFHGLRELAQMDPAYPPPVYAAYPPPVYAAYPPPSYGADMFDEASFTGFRRLLKAHAA